MEEEEPGQGASGPPQKHKARQLPFAPYIPTSKQQQNYHKELMRFVIDAELPFKKLDNTFCRNVMQAHADCLSSM